MAHRQRLQTHRSKRAIAAATLLLPELAELAADRSAADLEDAICARLGERMVALEEAEAVEDKVNPNTFAEALVTHAAEIVRDSSDAHAWRVLGTVARILPFPLNEEAAVAMAELRALPGGGQLPSPPAPVSVSGPVLWARDAYGSRFGITAMFSAPDRADRWYLWDVDACGLAAFTVHSGYFPDAQTALARWREGVGDASAADAQFAPVDDIALVSELLPAEEGFMRIGGEDVAQMAEYHREKRLADEVRTALGDPGEAAPGDGLHPERAGALFTAWLTERGKPPVGEAADEAIDELTTYWNDRPNALYHTCSAHRVANAVRGIRDFYQAHFAEQMVALLPDWAAWLSSYNGTPLPLAERAIRGAHEAAASTDRTPWNPLARVQE
ncbi:hypothetical protein [Allorhizocola rhizosphaerae]|uniref:hypothetical protein n=1 Tax=Allorhizocola rhizosphaerae TaxID=1872709 RepID=UPI0013C346AE|nr:hypothetical protein [Allorhizocola rhizosphaerae]